MAYLEVKMLSCWVLWLGHALSGTVNCRHSPRCSYLPLLGVPANREMKLDGYIHQTNTRREVFTAIPGIRRVRRRERTETDPPTPTS